ncbi:uncharacterized protein LOC110007303 [Amborella trichopoda]|uniref:uncharacterized protein LOC110007303 n=1 Tax=Amborella trichopoda TaxID=13333 RepID=UPI0009C0A5FB|nr:uncharacterized protein LOC110007303 [Amborella trichopoda]|eukprot:XP_020523102.1 uncharacterized protein LOC110007303 [Amborella trichopoda]
MAAATVKLLSTLLLLCIIGKGYAAAVCPLTVELEIAKVGATDEYAITFTNVCICPLNNVVLGCPPFDAAHIPNPSIIRHVTDTTCILKDGQEFKLHESVQFLYTGPNPDKFYTHDYKWSCT